MNPSSRPFVPRNRNQNQNQNQSPIVRNIQPPAQPYGVHNMLYPDMTYVQPSTQFISQPYNVVHYMNYPHVPPPPSPPPPPINHVQQPSIQSKIRNQIHHYFSKDNLCRDVYLRKHMDGEGFVPIQFIATFPKFKELSDNVFFILDSLKDSPIVEVKGELIRSKNDWESFVLSPELRIVWSPDSK